MPQRPSIPFIVALQPLEQRLVLNAISPVLTPGMLSPTRPESIVVDVSADFSNLSPDFAPIDPFADRAAGQAAAGPIASILQPDPGNTFREGQQIFFRGSAVSSTGAALPASGFEWRAAIHDRGRSRGIIEPIRGVIAGSFVVPELRRLSPDAFLRIALRVTDLSGRTDAVRLNLAQAPENAGELPIVTINQPRPNDTFSPGDVLNFDGFAFDPQDLFLPEQNLTWRFALHVDGRTRGLVDPIRGVDSGSIRIPLDLPAMDEDDFIRVALTAVDSEGLRNSGFVDIAPREPIVDPDPGFPVPDQAPLPQILFPVDGAEVSPGQRVQFSGTANDPQDGLLGRRRFVWRAALHDQGRTRGIIEPIRNARSGSFVIPANLGTVSDNAFIRLGLRVRDSDGNDARTFVDLPLRELGGGSPVNDAPEATITLPTEDTLYSAGETITFSGAATDAEDGVIRAERFVWRAAIHNDGRTRGLIRPVPGVQSGTFTLPETLPPNPDQFIRVALDVTDDGGKTSRAFVDIRPRTSALRINSNFPDVPLVIRLDGTTRLLPIEELTAVGGRRVVNAPRIQNIGGLRYRFVRWSDGGDRIHRVLASVPDLTLTAIYTVEANRTEALTSAGRAPAPTRFSFEPIASALGAAFSEETEAILR